MPRRWVPTPKCADCGAPMFERPHTCGPTASCTDCSEGVWWAASQWWHRNPADHRANVDDAAVPLV